MYPLMILHDKETEKMSLSNRQRYLVITVYFLYLLFIGNWRAHAHAACCVRVRTCYSCATTLVLSSRFESEQVRIFAPKVLKNTGDW